MITNYQLSRKERMSEYLKSLEEEVNRINGDESVIWLAKDFLNTLSYKISQQNQVLEVPDCCPNNGSQGDFHIMFTWDKEEHYLECEIMNSGLVEFFYRNRLTKEIWEYEHILQKLSEKAKEESKQEEIKIETKEIAAEVEEKLVEEVVKEEENIAKIEEDAEEVKEDK